MSGQEVSREKTSILFSKNVDRNTRVKLVQMSGFRESNQLGKYLGVPLKGRAPRREDFQYVIDQVSAKLTNWKAQHLSFAGRVTLAKSVIEAIPIYPMMTNKIPKSCLEEIQKLQRNFIWGDRDGVKKYHAIGWEKVTKPKYCGGLGLRRLDVMNQACILKLGWKLASGANDLWCKVMRGKYDCRAMKGEVRVQNSASSLWKYIVKLSPKLDNLCFWAVGDGADVDAWQHAWIQEGMRVIDQINNIPEELLNIKVCDLVDDEGKWNWNLLQGWMPLSLKNRIAAILPPSPANGKDIQVVAGAGTDKFSVAVMYKLLCNFEKDDMEDLWKHLWTLHVTERTKYFMWIALHDRLLTNAIKARMGLVHGMCDHCREFEETSLHVLRNCIIAKNVWMMVVPQQARVTFFGGDIVHWFHINLHGNLVEVADIKWTKFWANVCYCLWTWHNKEKHHYNILRYRQHSNTIVYSVKTVAETFAQRFSRRGIYGRCLFT
jgi:hypothetical protein